MTEVPTIDPPEKMIMNSLVTIKTVTLLIKIGFWIGALTDSLGLVL